MTNYPGGIITKQETIPTINRGGQGASGVWSIQEALMYHKSGLFPTTAATFTANLALSKGGYNGSASVNVIEQIDLTSDGNGSDFGDLTQVNLGLGAYGNTIRSLSAGGENNVALNVIEFVVFSTEGNSSDFGNLSLGQGSGFCMTGTATIAIPFYCQDAFSTYELITISTLGDAVDFGTLSSGNKRKGTACGSKTKILHMGGQEDPDQIEFLNPQSGGASTDFGGTLPMDRKLADSVSTEIRVVVASGHTSASRVSMDFITIATAGNASDFGDLTSEKDGCAGASTETKGVFIAGKNDSAGTILRTIDKITIATAGDAGDFGDIAVANQYHAASSSSNTSGL